MDLCELDCEAGFMINVNSRSFKEFGSVLDELTAISDPELYLEVVIDPNPKENIISKVGGIARDTAKTTRDVTDSYGRVVNSNASAIKTIWALMIKCLNIVISAINFIIRNLSKIPAAILSLIEHAEKIPGNIRNKIRGNIQLYITAEDISALYNKKILYQLDTFIGLGERLSKGTGWSTLFRHRSSEGKGGLKEIIFGENDMKLCKEMDKIYGSLKRLQFEQTTIDMSSEESRELYFGSKSIVFNDLTGKHHEENYLRSLYQLTTDINKEKEKLDIIRQSIGTKYSDTQANEMFSKLSGLQRDRIVSTIRMMSSIISVVGNMVRYIAVDIDTINKATNAMLGKQGVKPVVTNAKKETKMSKV